MTAAELNALPHGAYLVHWSEDDGGGTSVGVCGSLYSGARWFAFANWTVADGRGIPGATAEQLSGRIHSVDLIQD